MMMCKRCKNVETMCFSLPFHFSTLESNNNITMTKEFSCESWVYALLVVECKTNYENLGRNIDSIIQVWDGDTVN